MNENISMLQTALRFLDEHNEISFATCKGDLPKIRIFQIMRREDHMLYFATSAEKAVWRELQQNPNVELLAYADNISVRCRGMVTFDVEDSVKQMAAQLPDTTLVRFNRDFPQSSLQGIKNYVGITEDVTKII